MWTEHQDISMVLHGNNLHIQTNKQELGTGESRIGVTWLPHKLNTTPQKKNTLTNYSLFTIYLQ